MIRDIKILPTTFAALNGILPRLTVADRAGSCRIYYDLAAQMRVHKVTLRQLAERGDITLARIREIRDGDKYKVPFLTALDCQDAIEHAGGDER